MSRQRSSDLKHCEAQPRRPAPSLTRLLGVAAIALGLANVVWLPPAASRPHADGAESIAAKPLECKAPAGPPRDAPAPQSVPSATDAICPTGMVLVDGDYCPAVAHRCTKYLSEEHDRCAEYAVTGACFGTPEPERFCMDRFEYPNRRGTKPWVAVTWEEAKALCEAMGKRLCTEREWTLACEGDGRLPYPYGYRRDATACNIDKPYRFPDNSAYANPATREQEIARLDQREPSGSRSACVTPHGIYDMTGNVDEWVVYTRGHKFELPYISGLKGGYWGPVRNRCRPITATHNPWHSGYQIGFRCCADPPPPGRAGEGLAAGLQCSLR